MHYQAQIQLLLFLALLRLQACIGACCKFVLEFLNPARRVHELQLARVKRMANAANVDLQLRTSTASLKGIPTTASNGRFMILWMNVRLHNRFSSLLFAERRYRKQPTNG